MNAKTSRTGRGHADLQTTANCGRWYPWRLLVPLLAVIVPSALAAADAPLKLQRVTPTGEEVQPGRQIVFQFNQPVVAVGRMERSAEEIPISITPDPGCEWRWLNTSALACQLGEENPLAPATRYRIVVRPGLTAVSGARLEEESHHEFATERPRVRHTWFKTWTSPGTPKIRLTFNQPIVGDSLIEQLRFVAGKVHREVSIEPVNEYGSSWLVWPRADLPPDSEAKLVAEPGIRSQEGPEASAQRRTLASFRTFPPHRLLGLRCRTPHGQPLFFRASRTSRPEKACNPLASVELVFSSPVVKETLRDHLRIVPDLAGGRDDHDPWDNVGSYSQLSHQRREHSYDSTVPGPFRAYDLYRLQATAADLRDEFGRPLAEDLDFTFYTAHRKPRLVLDHDASVLESAVDSHLPVVVTNLQRIDAAFTRIGPDGSRQTMHRSIPVPEVEDVAFRMPLKVRDWLDGDSGAVVGHLKTQPETGSARWFLSQVTPFQVHTKVGHYNTTVWVTDLASGRPVPEARVELLRWRYETLNGNGKPLATATADEAGLATLPGTETLDPQGELSRPWHRRDAERFVIRVTHRGEQALLPLGEDFHTRAEGPNESYLAWDLEPEHGHLNAWGFTAQGIYRAGDEIDYKIYLRKEGNRRLETAPTEAYTLTVVDPQGKTVHRREAIELSAFGAFDGRFRVAKNGAVGWYRFELTADFAKERSWYPLRVLVSDFTPASFHVTTDLDGELFHTGDLVTVNARAALHSGGPYVDADTRVTATISPGSFTPGDSRARGFRFDVGAADGASVYSDNLQLDARGELTTQFTVPEQEILYGDLTVESAVRDNRGKSIAGRTTARYAGRDRYVGIRQNDWVLQAGEPAAIQGWVADEYGQLLADAEIVFTVERLETHAARVKGAGNAYLTQYSHKWKAVDSCTATTSAEPAECTFLPEQAGEYRFSAAVHDTRERPVQSRLRRWAVGKGRVLWQEPAGHHLQIEPEKETLRIGETARYLIKNPFPGATALVTLERFGVIRSWVEDFEDSSQILEFEVEPDLLPGFYLSVVVTSQRVAPPPEDDQVDLGKPAFRLGYVRVPVRDPYKELVVDAQPSADVFKPGETVRVELDAGTRQGTEPPVEYAVAVVDEAVLDLLPQGTGLYDPYAGLYALRPLDLVNYNLIKALIGWQKFEKKGADPGGGGGADARLRSVFKFLAYWNPSLAADEAGRAEFEFTVPDNLTGWRVLAVAVTPEDYLGLGEATFKVNLPTEIRPALPNQVVEGDRFEATFTVMNRTERRRTLRVKGSAMGAVGGEPTVKKKVKAEPFKRYRVSLPVTATGPGEIRFEVEAGDRRDRDGLSVPLTVRRFQALKAAATYGSTTDGEVSEAVHFPAGIRTDVGRISLVASPTVLGSLAGAFDYLRTYPYECWEQRLTKGTMAAHYLALRGYLPSAFSWPEAAELPQRALQRAADFQAPNGGLTYWIARDEYASPYLSAYTALAFGWLRDLGYEVPGPVEEALHGYLGRMLRQQVFPDFYNQGMASSVRAVALAALARAGKLEEGDLERYRGHLPQMDLFAKAHYLEALLLAEADTEPRAEVLDAILAHGNESGGKIVFSERLDDGYARILHSDLRTNCAILSALSAESAAQRETVGVGDLPFKIVHTITQTRAAGRRWENTQENMFCTRALLAYAREFEATPPEMKLTARLDEETFGSGEFHDLRDQPLEFERALTAEDPGREATVHLSREGAGRLYYALRLFYSPLGRVRQRTNSGIDVRREYSVERDGQWQRLEDPAQLEQGELVRVDLYLSVPAPRNFVVVDDPVPGGLEPVNRDLATASTVDADKAAPEFPPDAFYHEYDDWRFFSFTRWGFYHQELRHDSARFYSEYLPAGRYHLSYVAQVIAPGTFAALPVHAEEMYDPDVYGQGLGGTLQVRAAED